MSEVSAIRNLGPAMQAAFAGAGITSAEMLRELGADAAYAQLIGSGHRPHFMAYCALVLGLQDRPWQDLGAAEKSDLRARFDALRAGAAVPEGIEQILDQIGTGPR